MTMSSVYERLKIAVYAMDVICKLEHNTHICDLRSFLGHFIVFCRFVINLPWEEAPLKNKLIIDHL